LFTTSCRCLPPRPVLLRRSTPPRPSSRSCATRTRTTSRQGSSSQGQSNVASCPPLVLARPLLDEQLTFRYPRCPRPTDGTLRTDLRCTTFPSVEVCSVSRGRSGGRGRRTSTDTATRRSRRGGERRGQSSSCKTVSTSNSHTLGVVDERAVLSPVSRSIVGATAGRS
jgi:hypothetical protein